MQHIQHYKRRVFQVAPTLYSGIEINGCRPVAAQDLAAKPTAACLGPLTTVFLGALTSANDDARRAKQALILGNAIVSFADKLPNSARKSKAVVALWGPAGSVRASLSATAKSYVDEPSVGVQCTRMLSSLKQVRPREMSSSVKRCHIPTVLSWVCLQLLSHAGADFVPGMQVFDGEQIDSSESEAQAKAREKKRLKDERRAKRAAKAAAQEERRRKLEEEGGAAGHVNGVDPKAKKKKTRKAQKATAAADDGLGDDDEDDAPFAVDEGVVLDDELGAAADHQVDDGVENDPAYQEFLRQVAIEEEKANGESAAAGRTKRKKGRK